MSEIYYTVKLAGNEGSGKSCFYKKLTTGEFKDKHISTLGVDKKTINLKLDINKNGKIEKKDFRIDFYDIQSIEKYGSLTNSYYKRCDGILLLYDITNRQSFDRIQNYIDIFKNVCKDFQKCAIILIGNKSDLIEEEHNLRAVTEEEAKELCNKNGMLWGGEISIKTIALDEIKLLFEEYIKKIYEKVGVVIFEQHPLRLERPRKRNHRFLC